MIYYMYYIYIIYIYISQDPSVSARMRANKYVALADIFPPQITGFAILVVLKYYKSQISEWYESTRNTSAYVSIRQHTSAYVSIRLSIRQRVLETLRMQGQQVGRSADVCCEMLTYADVC
jgi:hypothetical protein